AAGAHGIVRHGDHHWTGIRRTAGAQSGADSANAGPAEGMTTPGAAPPSGTRVLIIDDDERLNAVLTEYLGRFGFSVHAATHPVAGLRSLKGDPPDLLILDVMLPGMDGLAVCKQVRESSRVPIIMLTARGDVTDRIVGLELGADDYLPKPF